MASADKKGTLALTEVTGKDGCFTSCRTIESCMFSSDVVSITSQPRCRAISPSSVRSTVFPDPRGPVMRMSLEGDPGPSSMPSTKSSSAVLRPMSTGGIIPAVGLKGLMSFIGLPLDGGGCKWDRGYRNNRRYRKNRKYRSSRFSRWLWVRLESDRMRFGVERQGAVWSQRDRIQLIAKRGDFKPPRSGSL